MDNRVNHFRILCRQLFKIAHAERLSERCTFLVFPGYVNHNEKRKLTRIQKYLIDDAHLLLFRPLRSLLLDGKVTYPFVK